MTTSQNNPETEKIYQFNADINQLMKLIINSVYSDKEIFLRELISNSSDALDKVRYLSITNQDMVKDMPNMEISIVTDKQNNTITIEDTGIGMTKEELINNLGTIAKSGTKQFIKSLTNSTSENNDLKLIGQFGIGFYSVFLVSNNVEVLTKSYDGDEYLWTSDENGFTLKKMEEDKRILKRGTRIVLHLRDSELEFLEEERIKDIVKKHSQFVSYKISLLCEKVEEVPVEDEDEDVENLDEKKENENENENENEVTIEDVTEEEAKETKTTTETKMEFEVLNKQDPIWIRKKTEVSDEEYNNFYKSISNDWDNPVTRTHFSVEGSTSFKSVLFLPNHSGTDMYSPGKCVNRIKLYVRRVFVLDKCEEVIPEYFHFVTGIVDSDDLSLNVSREILQKNNIIKNIRKILVKRIIKMMDELSKNDEEKYQKFYNEYHKNIKWGINEDHANRDKLSKLLRYVSSKSDDKAISLAKYVEDMPKDQKHIYYITGESLKTVKNSPFLETLNKKNYAVLFMTDPIDEYVVQGMKQYDEMKMIDITKGDLNIELTEKEKKKEEEDKKTYDKMCSEVKNILSEYVENVILSKRVVDSPCCISSTEYGWSANMARIMRAQALRDSSMNDIMSAKKIFELNPQHKTIKLLKNKFDNINDGNKGEFANIVRLLYQTCLIVSGFSVIEPEQYSKKVYNLINLGLGDYDDDDDDSEKEDEQQNETQPEEIVIGNDGQQNETQPEEIVIGNDDELEMEGID